MNFEPYLFEKGKKHPWHDIPENPVSWRGFLWWFIIPIVLILLFALFFPVHAVTPDWDNSTTTFNQIHPFSLHITGLTTNCLIVSLEHNVAGFGAVEIELAQNTSYTPLEGVDVTGKSDTYVHFLDPKAKDIWNQIHIATYDYDIGGGHDCTDSVTYNNYTDTYVANLDPNGSVGYYMLSTMPPVPATSSEMIITQNLSQDLWNGIVLFFIVFFGILIVWRKQTVGVE